MKNQNTNSLGIIVIISIIVVLMVVGNGSVLPKWDVV